MSVIDKDSIVPTTSIAAAQEHRSRPVPDTLAVDQVDRAAGGRIDPEVAVDRTGLVEADRTEVVLRHTEEVVHLEHHSPAIAAGRTVEHLRSRLGELREPYASFRPWCHSWDRWHRGSA
jgi:hypothetical protein